MEEIKPITPEELMKSFDSLIHPSMIKTINLLLSRFNGYSVRFTEQELIDQFLIFEPSYDRSRIFDERHLEFEGLYIRAGWIVESERPGFDESFEPFYIFKIKK